MILNINLLKELPFVLLRQYLNIKDKYNDCLIFFRLGDFYELFFEDAEVSSKVLGITLTKRGQVEGKDIPMCGVPFHQGENYLSKLLKAGYKVAICEQTETPEESKKRGYKAIIERKVVRIATPGTLTEESELGELGNNYLMALIALDQNYGSAWVDISTGEVGCKDCKDFNDLQETSLIGMYASGDVTNQPFKQIIIATGEGAKAALSINKYLNK